MLAKYHILGLRKGNFRWEVCLNRQKREKSRKAFYSAHVDFSWKVANSRPEADVIQFLNGRFDRETFGLTQESSRSRSAESVLTRPPRLLDSTLSRRRMVDGRRWRQSSLPREPSFCILAPFGKSAKLDLFRCVLTIFTNLNWTSVLWSARDAWRQFFEISKDENRHDRDDSAFWLVVWRLTTTLSLLLTFQLPDCWTLQKKEEDQARTRKMVVKPDDRNFFEQRLSPTHKLDRCCHN